MLNGFIKQIQTPYTTLNVYIKCVQAVISNSFITNSPYQSKLCLKSDSPTVQTVKWTWHVWFVTINTLIAYLLNYFPIQ